MKIFLISSVLILIGGALSQDIICVGQMGSCVSISLTERGLSREDINELIQARVNGLRSEIIQNFSKNKICSIILTMKECIHATATGNCADDATLKDFKAQLPTVELAYNQLQCGCASAVASLSLILQTVFLVFYQTSSL